MTRTGWSVSTEGWQEDAWDMFSLVGELRFLATTLAMRMSSAKFYVGKLSDDRTQDPEPVEDADLTEILDALGGTESARHQMFTRLGVNLFVAGDGWLVGIPSKLIPKDLRTIPEKMQQEDPQALGDAGQSTDRLLLTNPTAQVDPDTGQEITPSLDDFLQAGTYKITDLDWRMLSLSEVALLSSGQVQLKLGEHSAEWVNCSPDDLFLIRVWRPHPRRSWQADSPTRSSLPVLRQLVGLTMRTGAEVDSRLAGAGVLVVPTSASRALKVAMGLPEDSEEDPFTSALIEAMLTPIKDRSSASAVVPLVATVPDESAELIRHLSFATPLDEYTGDRVDQSLRRLALGLDAPPEILLGTSGTNHWGAWLVQDDVVSTHLKPPLALICDALTSQYLWPVLLDQGKTPEQIRDLVIWFDVSGLVVRPTASQDALVLHERGVISAEALRKTSGFDESDAPTATDGENKVHPIEVTMALDIVAKAPSLMSEPGLPAIVAQIRAVLNGNVPDISPEDLLPSGETSETSGGGSGEGETDDPDQMEPGAGPLPQPGEPEQPGPTDE